ncbi:cysteine sulfinic acid decarboxylase isoform X2 [Strix uralensis]|uniref:cysteine sulfinic acid decarboxylase isoform X2 n=1 Tax=Strix uralensis TaxID=36305 RepID=UPI003DA5A4A7
MAESNRLEHPGVDKAAGEEFLREALQVLLDEAVRKGTDVTEKVCDWKEPGELRELLDLELRSNGEPPERLLGRCRDVIRYSVRTGHPRFFNQLFSGLDHHALAGRLITEALNTSQYTYEIAPVFVLMEEVVLAKLRELVGWSCGDGIFAPGGSISNMYAMNVARFHRFPESRRKGSWALPRLALFTSRESHYSIQKGAAFLGIGTDNVHLVATDERGKMIPEELEKEIERAKAEGADPFFVCATCGTTVLGAFDPLGSIADICQRHGLWFHVDAAWGGSALLSTKHRHLLAGIERADSVAWNPHKMLTGLLQRCHGAGATYLFQPDKFYDVAYDTGDKTPQCGRRVDCLKLWLLWKAAGTEGLARRVERAFAFTRYLAEEVKRRDGFQLVLEPAGPGGFPRLLAEVGEGGSRHQGEDDEEGVHDGGLPAPRRQGQLLPADRHQPRRHQGRLGFLPGRDREAGTGSVRTPGGTGGGSPVPQNPPYNLEEEQQTPIFLPH